MGGDPRLERLDPRDRAYAEELEGEEREAVVSTVGRRYRPTVEQDPHPHARQPPLPRRAVLGVDPRRMTVDVAGERLGAVVDHLHGAARVEGQHRAVDLHREVFAAAEGAADAGEMDAHLLGREPQAGRDLVAVDVQPLGRDVQVDAAGAVGHRQP